MEIRLCVSFDMGWHKLTRNPDINTRRRVKTAHDLFLGILKNLGYVQSGAFYISPVGREATLVSCLSFSINKEPGILEVNPAISCIVMYDSPLNLMENIETMNRSLSGSGKLTRISYNGL